MCPWVKWHFQDSAFPCHQLFSHLVQMAQVTWKQRLLDLCSVVNSFHVFQSHWLLMMSWMLRDSLNQKPGWDEPKELNKGSKKHEGDNKLKWKRTTYLLIKDCLMTFAENWMGFFNTLIITQRFLNFLRRKLIWTISFCFTRLLWNITQMSTKKPKMKSATWIWR